MLTIITLGVVYVAVAGIGLIAQRDYSKQPTYRG